MKTGSLYMCHPIETLTLPLGIFQKDPNHRIFGYLKKNFLEPHILRLVLTKRTIRINLLSQMSKVKLI